MFSIEELKVLIDAVQASSFIPEKQSKELMEKLAKLGGYHRQEVLKGNMVTFNTRKHKDESIMQNVRIINDCISRHKKSRSITTTWTRIKRKDIGRTENVILRTLHLLSITTINTI